MKRRLQEINVTLPPLNALLLKKDVCKIIMNFFDSGELGRSKMVCKQWLSYTLYACEDRIYCLRYSPNWIQQRLGSFLLMTRCKLYEVPLHCDLELPRVSKFSIMQHHLKKWNGHLKAPLCRSICFKYMMPSQYHLPISTQYLKIDITVDLPESSYLSEINYDFDILCPALAAFSFHVANLSRIMNVMFKSESVKVLEIMDHCGITASWKMPHVETLFLHIIPRSWGLDDYSLNHVSIFLRNFPNLKQLFICYDEDSVCFPGIKDVIREMITQLFEQVTIVIKPIISTGFVQRTFKQEFNHAKNHLNIFS